jgi:hypothetical protein
MPLALNNVEVALILNCGSFSAHVASCCYENHAQIAGFISQMVNERKMFTIRNAFTEGHQQP